jgi:hypothetical protein
VSKVVDVVIVMSVPEKSATLADVASVAEPAYTRVFKFTFETVRDAEDYIKKGTLPEPGEAFADGFIGGGKLVYDSSAEKPNPLFDDVEYHRKYGH